MSAVRPKSPRPSTRDTVVARLRAVLGPPPSTWDGDSDPSTSDGRIPGRLLPAGARVDPGRRGAAALILVVVLSAAVVGFTVWRSRPHAEPVRPPPVLAAASASPSSAPALVVAVTGKVRRPGVVTLPSGARVIDALRAAGGPLPGADLTTLNLARKVADGELVAVGVPGAPADTGAAGGGGPATTGGKVNLNTATLEQLDGLPGVGPVLAQRILDWREANGPFTTVDQLREVTGIGDAKYGDLKEQVTV
jgi:competence protein ComEA